MNWITLTEADVLNVLSAAELTAYRNIALGSGQADPVAPTIADVTLQVRGYCAKATALGPDGTIPDLVKTAALALIAVALGQRVGKEASKVRQTAYDGAIKRLENVTKGELFGGGTAMVNTPTRLTSRDTLSGL